MSCLKWNKSRWEDSEGRKVHLPLSASEFLFLSQLINPHIFMIKTSINPSGLFFKSVRPCGRSKGRSRPGKTMILKSTPGAQVAQDASGYGRRSRSLSTIRRAHLEKPELCPRREAEGMMSCVRPSLSSHPSVYRSLHLLPPCSPPLPLYHGF